MATVDGLHGRGVPTSPAIADAARSCSCTRGWARSGCGADFPQALQRGHRAPRGRLLALRARALGPAARARARRRSSTRRRSTCCPRCWRRLGAPEPAARRPQRRRARSRSSTRAATPVERPGAAGARTSSSRTSRVDGDPRDAAGSSRRASCASAWPATTTTRTPRSTAGATSGSIPPSAPGASRPTRRAVDGAARCSSRAPTTRTARLDQLDRIEARVRGPVERLVVPGGHSPHLEQPEAVVAIAEFGADLP